MFLDGVRRIGGGHGWAVEETAGGGGWASDCEREWRCGRDLRLCRVGGAQESHRECPFSGLLVQGHELELLLDEHAVAGFLAPRVGASHRTGACLHR